MADVFFSSIRLPPKNFLIQGTRARIQCMNQFIELVQGLNERYPSSLIRREGEHDGLALSRNLISHALGLRPVNEEKQSIKLYDFLAICYYVSHILSHSTIDESHATISKACTSFFNLALRFILEISMIGNEVNDYDNLLNQVATMFLNFRGEKPKEGLARTPVEDFQLKKFPEYAIYDGNLTGMKTFRELLDIQSNSGHVFKLKDYFFEVYTGEEAINGGKDRARKFSLSTGTMVSTYYRTYQGNVWFYPTDPVTGERMMEGGNRVSFHRDLFRARVIGKIIRPEGELY